MASADALPLDIFDQHAAIVGTSGMGKSYFGRLIVEGWLEQGLRVCILDPTDVWWGLRSNAAGDGPGFPVAVFGGDHADVPIGDKSGERVGEIVATRNLPAIVSTGGMTGGEQHRFMTDFLGTLYRLNRAALHLVLDEADEMAPQNPLPETRRMLGAVDRIARRGRVKGFRVLMITQRPAVLHNNVLAMARALAVLGLPLPHDQAAIKRWIEGNASIEEGKELVGSLAALRQGEGWLWAPAQGVLRRFSFPQIRTFDSMRTPQHGETVAAPERLAPVDIADLTALFAADAGAPPEKEPQASGPHLNEAAIAAAEQHGYDRGLAAALPQARVEALAEFAQLAGAVVAKGNAMIAAGADLAEALRALAPGAAAAPPATEPIPVLALSGASVRQPRRKPGPTIVQTDDGLPPSGPSGVEARILGALAELAGIGVSPAPRVQVALLAGYGNAASKGFANAIGALRSKGHIDYPRRGAIALTEAGAGAAPLQPRALDNAELHRRIFRLLKRPEAAILRVLIDRYPAAPERSELGRLIGYSNTASKGFANSLGRLRSLGLIDYPVRGRVAATAMVFATSPRRPPKTKVTPLRRRGGSNG